MSLFTVLITTSRAGAETEVSDYFAQDYQEARAKFIQSSQSSNGKIEEIKHSSKGPDGKNIYTDITLLGSSEAETFIVVSSGLHGVEGFAGSGLQVGFLKERIFSHLPANTSILFVHAINPYGFSHIRRYDDANVDLNRNFVNFDHPLPANKQYKELADILAPETLSLWETVKTYWRIGLYWAWYGKDYLQSAISRGQYIDPKGLFYGGNRPSWSNLMIRKVFHRYLSKAKKVIVLDVHTGLGEMGELAIIMNQPKESPAYKRAVSWWGDKVITTYSDSVVSTHLSASFKLAIPNMLPNAEVTAVSLEFGTYSPRQVLMALRDENWLFHHDNDADKEQRDNIKQRLLEMFYPDSLHWKKQVWKNGKSVIDDLIKKL